jgi:hypothetical protein
LLSASRLLSPSGLRSPRGRDALQALMDEMAASLKSLSCASAVKRHLVSAFGNVRLVEGKCALNVPLVDTFENGRGWWTNMRR